MLDETPRCKGTRQDGTPCQAPPHTVGADGFCWAHSPAKREARRAARVKGGKGKATANRVEKLVPSHMRPVLGAVLSAIRDVRAGSLTPAQGSAIAALAGAAVRVYSVGVLEERLRALEETATGRGAA
jgi:hypothetical protein